jgi:1-deoxy-D-xylulose-5-phosphate reductoisomerase
VALTRDLSGDPCAVGALPGAAAAAIAGLSSIVAAGRPRSVTVLGSTGSVGTSTVDLLAANPELFRVRALVGGRNAALLAEQAIRLGAELAVIYDPDGYAALAAALAGSGVAAAAGTDSVLDAAGLPADWTMAAITGAAGLPATLAAIRRGGTLALANKEALVCAGDVMLEAVRAAGAVLLPVDSEHNAIFQALAEGNRDRLERIVLTASGGPFRTASLAEMQAATPAAALRHPVWSMGAKISIDSATLMNKGLEVIEAARLFALEDAQIGVLVHPQSVVHGLVCYADGSMLAQLGAPDMRIPIAHALAWPGRLATSSARLDLAALGRLEFAEPDPQRFPALPLARAALRAGGGAPTILSAANEVAVAAFLDGRIGFLDIAAIAGLVLDRLGSPPAASLAAVMELDRAARACADRLAAARPRPCP